MAIGDDNPNTPVEKLCALFASRTVTHDFKRGTQAERRHNGLRNLADALGCHKTLIIKWNRQGGSIPLAWRSRVMEAADLLGVRRDGLNALLSAEKCPCCGQMVEPGAVHA